MLSIQVAALMLAAATGGDTVLLDFHADWCGPCRNMAPVVEQLSAAGYPIRKVNIDHERALAAQYHVQSIPCYVLLVGGQEINRAQGAMSAHELADMFAKARLEPTASHSRPGKLRGQSPDPPLMPVSRPAASPALAGAKPQPPAAGNAPAAPPEAAVPTSKLLESSVRLTIEDRDGFSYGSGTIIDAQQGEALILTCGHIFRDSQGKGKITVDVFGPQAAQKIVGRVISYDLKRDVGLVSIRAGVPVTVARVSPGGHRLAAGDRVVNIGCNNGAVPTARDSKVTSLDKFLGPSNVQVAGQPVQGRSGGGLFDAQGYVVGVCNAADPTDNEGLYAAAATIHEELDHAGLTALYQPGDSTGPQSLAGSERAAGQAKAALAGAGLDRAPAGLAAGAARSAAEGLQKLNADERATLAKLGTSAQGAEVICIVRSHADPQSKSEIIVLDRASAVFLERLAAEQSTQTARHLTSLEVPRGEAGRTCPIDGGTAVHGK